MSPFSGDSSLLEGAPSKSEWDGFINSGSTLALNPSEVQAQGAVQRGRDYGPWRGEPAPALFARGVSAGS